MLHNDVLKTSHNKVIKEKLSVTLIKNIARYANDVANGVKNVNLMSSRITNKVAASLQLRAKIRAASQHAQAHGQESKRTAIAMPSSAKIFPLTKNIIDAVVLMHENDRTFAISLRFEMLNDKWRATEIIIL